MLNSNEAILNIICAILSLRHFHIFRQKCNAVQDSATTRRKINIRVNAILQLNRPHYTRNSFVTDTIHVLIRSCAKLRVATKLLAHNNMKITVLMPCWTWWNFAFTQLTQIITKSYF